MKTTTMPDGSVLHVAEPSGGRREPSVMRFYDLAPNMNLHVCSGLMVPEFAALVIADCERKLKSCDRLITMVDSYESKQMSTPFREQMTRWFPAVKGRFVGNLLIRSKLIELAINIANMVVGTPVAKAFSHIPDWEAVGRQVVPGFKRRPLVLPAPTEA
jgi:hypothetical protein